jgi:hypothetical protein
MRRIANAPAVFGLAIALAGLASCVPVQNPYGNTGAAKAGPLGSSTSFGSSSSLPPPSSAGTVAGGTIDSAGSQGLSDYLKSHSLPLVGAQVVTSGSGGKQVILFGFVASEFGKADAEQKARHYLKDASIVVDNRIKISPELGGMRAGAPNNLIPSAADGSDPYAATGSLQDYQNNQPPDAYAYQAQQQQLNRQYQQYNSQPPSMFSTLLPMLFGGGGMSMGSGGYGGSMGGFNSGYAPSYGSYGYPTYPPPMPGSGFGPPGNPY